LITATASADQIAQMATNPEALNRRPAHR
jgi:hypothetical protein